MNPRVVEITEKICERSRSSRERYLQRVESRRVQGVARGGAGCANLAHVMAASDPESRRTLGGEVGGNLGILTAYNDMLSAHQPYVGYPDLLRRGAKAAGGTAQVAGGVPAMCDGITQGTDAMELSLLSRDVIALSAAVGLSHGVFDAVAALGVCDKIVPGLLIAALRFGHLPFIFVPAGPMPSGVSNKEKAATRQRYAEGRLGRADLLAVESGCYHSAGTCTFYGTANTNQMLMEFMGLHLPGSSFVPPGSPLRDALTVEAGRRVLTLTSEGGRYTPVGHVISERALVNALVGLLATGGSTNLTIHLVAIAKAAGVKILWDDIDALSRVVPLIARVYPNGEADINHFHQQGGTGRVMTTLREEGYLHSEVVTVMGEGLENYSLVPTLKRDALCFESPDCGAWTNEVISEATRPFSSEGGLRLLEGNLGRAIIKTSAVDPKHQRVRARAAVFDSPEDLIMAFRQEELNRDVVAVVRFVGPRANGMPELHRLMAPLGVLMDRGFQVALLTDGRLSGASGKIPAAIHATPEAVMGGPLSRLRTGDWVTLDAPAGCLMAEVDPEEWARRCPGERGVSEPGMGWGGDLFSPLRGLLGSAEDGGTIFGEMESFDEL